MSWSLVETRTLAIKAACGAGFSWGIAEEAGFAVHWLQAQGAPGVEALGRLLEWGEKPGNKCSPVRLSDNVSEPVGQASPLELGAALMDANRSNCSALGRVCQPLLLVPFIAAKTNGQGCRLIWGDISIVLGSDCFHSTAPRDALLTEAASCFLSTLDDELPTPAHYQRVPDDDSQAIDLLGRYAARTYAPATEISRLAGAGAGLTDND